MKSKKKKKLYSWEQRVEWVTQKDGNEGSERGIQRLRSNGTKL
jgi:hypothetical protein